MVACAAGACQRANQIIANSNLLYIAVSERENKWVRESAGDSVNEEGKSKKKTSSNVLKFSFTETLNSKWIYLIDINYYFSFYYFF